MTGHISRPIRNRNDGHRYARQSRRRQISSPTIDSANSSTPRIRKPEANHQWTNSERGSILRLREIVDEPRRHHERKPEPDQNDVQRRLGNEPPEALAVRVEQRQPVRLQERPNDAGEPRQRAERGS